jgi:uncharacterized protein Smg (DUF494 family)
MYLGIEMSENAITILDSMITETIDLVKSYASMDENNVSNSCLLPYAGYRVLSPDETQRLTKASYQFISRIQLLNVIPHYIFELFLHELLLSHSEYILLEEVKFVLFMVLEEHFTTKEIDFIKFAISKKQQECSIVH